MNRQKIEECKEKVCSKGVNDPLIKLKNLSNIYNNLTI